LKIIDLICETPHLILTPSGFGEPLIDKNISIYIALAHELKRMTRLITNASLLDESKASDIMGADLDVLVLSVDAADGETYKKVSPGLDWEQTLSNIQNLKRIRKGHRTYITLNIVKQPENESKIDEIVRFWSPHVDSVRIATATRHWKEIGERPPPVNCLNPWKSMIIFSNGEIPLCLRDVEGEYSLGNVLERSPIEIWNSETAKEYRRRILEGDHPEICHHCDSFKAYDSRLQRTRLKWKLTKDGP
jgi:radical SAM protein with 4Fe4S-binding SPASM domain